MTHHLNYLLVSSRRLVAGCGGCGPAVLLEHVVHPDQAGEVRAGVTVAHLTRLVRRLSSGITRIRHRSSPATWARASL